MLCGETTYTHKDVESELTEAGLRKGDPEYEAALRTRFLPVRETKRRSALYIENCQQA